MRGRLLGDRAGRSGVGAQRGRQHREVAPRLGVMRVEVPSGAAASGCGFCSDRSGARRAESGRRKASPATGCCGALAAQSSEGVGEGVVAADWGGKQGSSGVSFCSGELGFGLARGAVDGDPRCLCRGGARGTHPAGPRTDVEAWGRGFASGESGGGSAWQRRARLGFGADTGRLGPRRGRAHGGRGAELEGPRYCRRRAGPALAMSVHGPGERGEQRAGSAAQAGPAARAGPAAGEGAGYFGGLGQEEVLGRLAARATAGGEGENGRLGLLGKEEADRA